MTTSPDRPPYDGNRSEGFALTDVPWYVEHGEEAFGAALGFTFTMCPRPELLYDLSTGDEWNEPDLRDGVFTAIMDVLESTYQATGDGVWMQWDVQDVMWDRVNQRGEVIINVEFGAGPYQGDESLDDWVGRIIAGAPLYRVVDDMWTFYRGQERVEEALQLSLRLSRAGHDC